LVEKKKGGGGAQRNICGGRMKEASLEKEKNLVSGAVALGKGCQLGGEMKKKAVVTRQWGANLRMKRRNVKDWGQTPCGGKRKRNVVKKREEEKRRKSQRCFAKQNLRK